MLWTVENCQEILSLLAGFQAKSTNSKAKEIQLTFLLAAGCWLLAADDSCLWQFAVCE
jgi:hypothetical protein